MMYFCPLCVNDTNLLPTSLSSDIESECKQVSAPDQQGYSQQPLTYIFLYMDVLSLKPNSHQTIFPTDSHRRPPIQESVGVGRFFFFKSVGVT